MKWISVKDKLPQGYLCCSYHEHLSEQVLVCNSCAIEIACYNRSNGIWYVGEPLDNEWIDKITHWMPLPINPHKGDTNETNTKVS